MTVLLGDGDPLAWTPFAGHTLGSERAPHAYDIIRARADGAVEIVLHP